MQQAEVQAAEKVINLRVQQCKDVTKIVPEATKHFGIDDTSENYSYVFRIKVPEASQVRIAGLGRYTFWNGSGTVKYKLTDALKYYDATYTETWSKDVYADHYWEEMAGNYCDKTFLLGKGTYYLFVNTELKKDWREETYGSSTIYDYPLGLWLSVNSNRILDIPKLKSVKNNKASTINVKMSGVKKAKGYQVQYSTSKKFTNKYNLYGKKTTLNISKLKKNKTYYVRTRAYKLIDNKKYYSNWSNVLKVKIRK